MSADNVLGREIVLKISHLPSKLRFSAKCSFFGQSLSRGHYQPTYQPPEGVYLLNSRSFLANQKARNAIVGTENLLKRFNFRVVNKREENVVLGKIPLNTLKLNFGLKIMYESCCSNVVLQREHWRRARHLTKNTNANEKKKTHGKKNKLLLVSFFCCEVILFAVSLLYYYH